MTLAASTAATVVIVVPVPVPLVIVIVVPVSVVVIIVSVVVGIFVRLLSFFLNGFRGKLHDQLKSLGHWATSIVHALNGCLDLYLSRYSSNRNTGRIVGTLVSGVVVAAPGIPFFPQR